MILYPRLIESRVAEAMADTPVVLIAGPRQAGKTTLVQRIADNQGLRYLTLDDDLTLLAAREDPVGMIRGLDRVVILKVWSGSGNQGGSHSQGGRLAGSQTPVRVGAGDKFRLGVILYDGTETMPLGDRLCAAPFLRYGETDKTNSAKP